MAIPPTGPNSSQNAQAWGVGPNPPMMGPPLPLSNIWVKMLISWGVPPEQAQVYAERFEKNMMQMLTDQIKRDAAAAKKAADEWKQQIEEQ